MDRGLLPTGKNSGNVLVLQRLDWFEELDCELSWEGDEDEKAPRPYLPSKVDQNSESVTLLSV